MRSCGSQTAQLIGNPARAATSTPSSTRAHSAQPHPLGRVLGDVALHTVAQEEQRKFRVWEIQLEQERHAQNAGVEVQRLFRVLRGGADYVSNACAARSSGKITRTVIRSMVCWLMKSFVAASGFR